jgi:hypothetical protein
VVRYELTGGNSTNYIERVSEYGEDGATAVLDSAVGLYLFGDEQRYDYASFVNESFERGETASGDAACEYAVSRRYTAENDLEDDVVVTTTTRLVAGERGATTTITIRNVGDESAVLGTPENFVENGIRLGRVELADKRGEYRFAIPGAEPRPFNGTDYWERYPLSASGPRIVALNPSVGFAFGLQSGSTTVDSAMTEDGSDPRENSDTLTFNVAGTTLGPGESATWTVSHAVVGGGETGLTEYETALPDAPTLTNRVPVTEDTPTPDPETPSTATAEAGEEASPDDQSDAGTSTGDGAGFGVVSVVLAALVGTGVARHRKAGRE